MNIRKVTIACQCRVKVPKSPHAIRSWSKILKSKFWIKWQTSFNKRCKKHRCLNLLPFYLLHAPGDTIQCPGVAALSVPDIPRCLWGPALGRLVAPPPLQSPLQSAAAHCSPGLSPLHSELQLVALSAAAANSRTLLSQSEGQSPTPGLRGLGQVTQLSGSHHYFTHIV